MIVPVMLWAIATAAHAKKETDPILLALKHDMSLVASPQDDGTVKISAVFGKDFPPRAIRYAVLYKAATEAEKSGFHRFAIVRQKFWAIVSYNSLIDRDGVVSVKFMGPGETVTSAGPTFYFETDVAVASFKAIAADPDALAGKWGETKWAELK